MKGRSWKKNLEVCWEIKVIDVCTDLIFIFFYHYKRTKNTIAEFISFLY